MDFPELLAPAGSFACAQSAYDHGADAVYAGLGSFNLRAHSPNFNHQEMCDLIRYSHKRGKRVYLAVNIMPDNSIMKDLGEELVRLSDSGILPDSFIVSDPGVIRMIQSLIPQARLHLSTQTGCFNSQSLNFWKEQGINRVVLPRELTLSQISQINSEEILETEIFIHGAMCVSISGRCLLGAYLGRRHPNLGDCPQPCRYKYRITPLEGKDSSGVSFVAEESENGVYLLNSKDLCTLELLPQIVSSGVSSLKIEGRNKSAHYVATVVKVYREALDQCKKSKGNYVINPRWTEELESIEHRQYTTGFYGQEQLCQDLHSSKAKSKYRLVAVVKEIHDSAAILDIKNSFDITEKLNVLPVQQNLDPYEIFAETVTDLAGNPLTRANTNRLVRMTVSENRLRRGDMLRITAGQGR
ncbi:peptidase, U32 family large subunit [C1] [Chitinispirillum alkaliphilum]|nr:peptidase, U32 family large subunit [C1] [Chitinispirillum alkaliphilum]